MSAELFLTHAHDCEGDLHDSSMRPTLDVLVIDYIRAEKYGFVILCGDCAKAHDLPGTHYELMREEYVLWDMEAFLEHELETEPITDEDIYRILYPEDPPPES